MFLLLLILIVTLLPPVVLNAVERSMGDSGDDDTTPGRTVAARGPPKFSRVGF